MEGRKHRQTASQKPSWCQISFRGRSCTFGYVRQTRGDSRVVSTSRLKSVLYILNLQTCIIEVQAHDWSQSENFLFRESEIMQPKSVFVHFQNSRVRNARLMMTTSPQQKWSQDSQKTTTRTTVIVANGGNDEMVVIAVLREEKGIHNRRLLAWVLQHVVEAFRLCI